MFRSPYILLIAYICSVLSSSVHAYLITTDAKKIANHTFHYIIIGGGTTGLTIANRLTENRDITVLVIEAGIDDRKNPLITDPQNYLNISTNPENVSWGYTTTNQTINGQTQHIIAGKVLGGSSSINAMQWTRGTVAQYDAIERLGNPGWNFATFQKYMKKAEAFHAPNEKQIAAGNTYLLSAHGTSGRVISGFPNPYPSRLNHIWDVLIESAVHLFPTLRSGGDVDLCSGDPRGIARSTYSIIPGSTCSDVQNVRSSSAQSYVYSLAAADRQKLHILIQHQATRIIWKPKRYKSAARPAGVEIIPTSSAHGKVTIKVKKEVILTSGALGTPQILERSGIGNRDLLEGLGIEVQADLSGVGLNLQDQSDVQLMYSVNAPLNASAPHTPPSGVSALLTLSQLLGPNTANKYIKNLRETLTQHAERIVASGGGVSTYGVQRMLKAQLKQFSSQDAPVIEIIYITLGEQTLLGVVSGLLPRYRGSVHIMSTNPLVHPQINPNYLGTESDFLLLVNASIATRHIFLSGPARQLRLEEISPGPGIQTDDQWRTFVKDNYFSGLHPIGTASMLPRALGGVVDENLNVYGVQGVRVADASILPLQLSAHLSSTVYGIAEKAADLIKRSFEESA